jgi:hypothetical protein
MNYQWFSFPTNQSMLEISTKHDSPWAMEPNSNPKSGTRTNQEKDTWSITQISLLYVCEKKS